MISKNIIAPATLAFCPLAPLLQSIPPEKLIAARLRVAELDRHELISRFHSAFTHGKRVVALILADELTARGIPPAFRHLNLSTTDCSVNHRFDLMLADLRWLRRRYPEHVKSVRYGRYRDLFIMSEPAFHRAVEYAFYQGKRPAWKVVASMSLTLEQQWDSALLRSAPIKKIDSITEAMRERVFMALQDDLRITRRTKSFTDADAQAALLRRHALWTCSRMTNGSPTETAMRYEQLTGLSITRQAAAKQLEKVREILKKTR